MNINLTALTVKYMHGRQTVTCVPRLADETNKLLGPEQGLAQALNLVQDGHTITNAQEVLVCLVRQYGFGA